jgi:hypothetical protein
VVHLPSWWPREGRRRQEDPGARYAIEKTRLWEEEDEGYGWVRHVAEKDGVDIEDFAEALRIGGGVHEISSPRPGKKGK